MEKVSSSNCKSFLNGLFGTALEEARIEQLATFSGYHLKLFGIRAKKNMRHASK